MFDITPEYQHRLGLRRTKLAALERTHRRFSLARLAIFAGAVIILIAAGLASSVWLLVPVAIFIGVAVLHARLLNERDRTASAVAFYERGLERLEGRWAGHGRTGD